MTLPRFRWVLFLGFFGITFSIAALDLDWDEKGDFPPLSLPPLPNLPLASRSSETSQKAVVTETYSLQVTEALPGGNTRNNTADNIDQTGYLVYSNGSRELRISFKDGPPYIYYFQNPRPPLQTAPGVWRTAYNVIVQAGTEILGESYTAEIYSEGENKGAPSSITIFGGNTAVVVLNFKTTAAHYPR